MLLDTLNAVTVDTNRTKETRTYHYLNQIAEKLSRRSLVFLFSDMFQTEVEEEKLFEGLRHLKYNKHEVVLFHLLDTKRELNFDFDNKPKRFLDVETGKHIDVYADSIKQAYEEKVSDYITALKLKCSQYNIKYIGVDVGSNFSNILNTFITERKKFA